MKKAFGAQKDLEKRNHAQLISFVMGKLLQNQHIARKDMNQEELSVQKVTTINV